MKKIEVEFDMPDPSTMEVDGTYREYPQLKEGDHAVLVVQGFMDDDKMKYEDGGNVIAAGTTIEVTSMRIDIR